MRPRRPSAPAQGPEPLHAAPSKLEKMSVRMWYWVLGWTLLEQTAHSFVTGLAGMQPAGAVTQSVHARLA